MLDSTNTNFADNGPDDFSARFCAYLDAPAGTPDQIRAAQALRDCSMTADYLGENAGTYLVAHACDRVAIELLVKCLGARHLESLLNLAEGEERADETDFFDLGLPFLQATFIAHGENDLAALVQKGHKFYAERIAEGQREFEEWVREYAEDRRLEKEQRRLIAQLEA